MEATDETVPCPICYRDFLPSQLAQTTPCGHDMCPPCLDTWADQSRTCPMCRTTVTGYIYDKVSEIHYKEVKFKRADGMMPMLPAMAAFNLPQPAHSDTEELLAHLRDLAQASRQRRQAVVDRRRAETSPQQPPRSVASLGGQDLHSTPEPGSVPLPQSTPPPPPWQQHPRLQPVRLFEGRWAAAGRDSAVNEPAGVSARRPTLGSEPSEQTRQESLAADNPPRRLGAWAAAAYSNRLGSSRAPLGTQYAGGGQAAVGFSTQEPSVLVSQPGGRPGEPARESQLAAGLTPEQLRMRNSLLSWRQRPTGAQGIENSMHFDGQLGRWMGPNERVAPQSARPDGERMSTARISPPGAWCAAGGAEAHRDVGRGAAAEEMSAGGASATRVRRTTSTTEGQQERLWVNAVRPSTGSDARALRMQQPGRQVTEKPRATPDAAFASALRMLNRLGNDAATRSVADGGRAAVRTFRAHSSGVPVGGRSAGVTAAMPASGQQAQPQGFVFQAGTAGTQPAGRTLLHGSSTGMRANRIKLVLQRGGPELRRAREERGYPQSTGPALLQDRAREAQLRSARVPAAAADDHPSRDDAVNGRDAQASAVSSAAGQLQQPAPDAHVLSEERTRGPVGGEHALRTAVTVTASQQGGANAVSSSASIIAQLAGVQEEVTRVTAVLRDTANMPTELQGVAAALAAMGQQITSAMQVLSGQHQHQRTGAISALGLSAGTPPRSTPAVGVESPARGQTRTQVPPLTSSYTAPFQPTPTETSDGAARQPAESRAQPLPALTESAYLHTMPVALLEPTTASIHTPGGGAGTASGVAPHQGTASAEEWGHITGLLDRKWFGA